MFASRLRVGLRVVLALWLERASKRSLHREGASAIRA